MFCLYTLDGTLKSDVARRALLKCTRAIVESTIEPIALARRLVEEEVISEKVYKIVRDPKTEATSTERLDQILDDLKDHVERNANAFQVFLYILRDDSLNQQELADKIISKYKGMIHFNAYFITYCYLFQN